MDPKQSAASDEEDDYMNMTFEEPSTIKTAQPETSLQRRQRLRREGEIRGRVKSKEELAAEEAAAREKALSRSLLEDAAAKKSKGLAMMAKMGFKGGALGAGGAAGDGARTEPIAVEVKEDRGGIGMESEKKRKMREAAERIEEEVREGKRAKVDPLEYRDRVRQEREAARVQAQVFAAQRVAERMAEEKDAESGLQVIEKGEETDSRNGAGDEEEENMKKRRKPAAGATARPLKSINVLWRGLARHREEKVRDRRMRYDLEQSLSRLPTYEDDQEDEDDRTALGKRQTVYVTAEDLDEEDSELDEFNELEDAEKLRRLVEYLRKKHRYCFWCKFTYTDDEMEGCPGVTEEDHD